MIATACLLALPLLAPVQALAPVAHAPLGAAFRLAYWPFPGGGPEQAPAAPAALGPAFSGLRQQPRPFIYGCGVIWGKWLGLPDAKARAFDRLSMDRIEAMGATNIGANFAWIDIEPKPGKYDWSYADHQVEEARRHGLTIFAYTGLTPDWALPADAPKTPGIGYRFPPARKYIPQFKHFFTTLARRYRGRVKYYEFWNEENGCGWIKGHCANGNMAPSYVPWLKLWYKAMKAGDPNCVLAVGGLDYNAGVKDGWRYLDDIYKAGGGDYFDAVAIHPYGDPLHWQAIRDTYACLVRHGQGHKKLWLNEYGWNTGDEADKARKLREVLTRLAQPEYHMVFEASYLCLTDLPTTKDARGGHDFGLCSRNRKTLTITPRASYVAFRDLRKAWTVRDVPAAEADAAPRAAAPSPTGQSLPKPRRGKVPPGFLLYFDAPGVNPGQAGDDQGPPRSIRRAWIRRTGCNTAEFTIRWADTEPKDPGDGAPVFDFSRVHPDAFTLSQPHVICYLDFFGNPWADKFRFTDTPRYKRLLAQWAEAACRFARKHYGVSLFETGGNERDLVAPQTYRPHYPDWEFYYMDPIKAVHAGMKRAAADNRLIIGNLCYSDRNHIGALYVGGAKGNFEVLAIHAYGQPGCHVDMEQVIESHEEMAYRGDPNLPILVTEGWSSLPLPDSLDKDPAWHKGPRPYTRQEIEHFRQAVLDGWRNLTTPRPGMYDPSWVCGARFFVLNDFWGGRGWAGRAKPQYDAAGKLKGFLLDGYFIGTTDPDAMQPFLRPWGLIDIKGRAKGDTIDAFPPYVPRQRFTAALHAALPTVGYDPHRPELTCPEAVAGRVYRATAEFTNLEDAPMTQCQFRLSEKNLADYPGGYGFIYDGGVLDVFTDRWAKRLVQARRVGPMAPGVILPGQTVRLTYDVTFSRDLCTRRDDGTRQRVRPLVDLYYLWRGRPYHSDAWLPRVAVARASAGG